MIDSVAQPQALFAWMGSLADPTRLRLLRLLERHELGVAELCNVLQLPQSTVSRHLKVLGDQGWVRSRAQGTAHLYRTALETMDAAACQLWDLARTQSDPWAMLRDDELRLERRLQERQTESQMFFAGAAAEWDRLRPTLYGRGFAQAGLAALLPPNWVVSDLGCGTGQMLAEIAPWCRRVIGVDNSAAMLDAARARMGEHNNVELYCGDLDALPIEDRACDAALLVLALTYVQSPPSVLREAARILKVGGRLIVIDLLPHDSDDFRRRMGQLTLGCDPDRLMAMMRDVGLLEPNSRPLAPEPEAKGPRLFLATGVAA